jgi:hypoxanthine phosphoribosyltransferase
MQKLFTEVDINIAISRLARILNSNYYIEPPVCIVTLTGGLFFASDIMKQLVFDHTVEFIKTSSYKDNKQSLDLTYDLFPAAEKLNNKDIILFEDIVDTGVTLANIINKLEQCNIKKLTIVSLLDKPDARKINIHPTYYGYKVAKDDFVVGYGLDNNQIMRQLTSIYKL